MAWTKMKTAVIIMAIVVLGGGFAALAVKPFMVWRHEVAVAHGLTALARLRLQVWPEEKSRAEEKIRARQLTDETTGAARIDLKPYANATLAEAPICWQGDNGNNLAELPSGVHVFGGVPFDVQGVIYLTGGWLKDHYHKNYPAQVTGIRIDRRCAKIHLLHSAGYVLYDYYGRAVARLILHYADGSQREISILAGKNVCDMWAPLFATGIPAAYLTMSPGNEPAWTGSNAYLKKWQPDLSLVLYQSTFDNPQAGVTLSSIDYVSAETMSVPLLVGLTVE